MPQETLSDAMKAAVAGAETDLGTRYPEATEDIRRGVTAAAKVWPGEPAPFAEFCLQHYALPGSIRQSLLAKLDGYLGHLFGNMMVIQKEIRLGMDVDDGPLLPVDQLFAGYSPGATCRTTCAGPASPRPSS